MKEAVGTSFVFTFMMIFVSILIAMYVGSIAYTKGFKVRNKIIDIIEKYEGYTDEAKSEIDSDLASIGYRIVDKECGQRKGSNAIETDSDYRYCVYKFDETGKGTYYGVTIFIHFDIPVIGSFVEIPLYGESRLIYEKDKVTG